MGVTTSKSLDGTGPNNTSSTVSHEGGQSRKPVSNNSINKFIVIWLDPNFDESDVIYRNSISRLQRISVSINTFKNTSDCLQFLNKVKESKVLMVVAENVVKDITPRIRTMSNIYSVHILSSDADKNRPIEHDYDKVKGFYETVEPIYGSLKRETRKYQHDVLIMSIIPSFNYEKNDLKNLNQLFIYWFLVKQIIFDLQPDKDSHKHLAEFCRTHYTDNPTELKLIDEFESNYYNHRPIWWYTRECFLSIMLNRAFQTQDIEVIMKMGSFIQDLHNELEKLQQDSKVEGNLYRSQSVASDDFEKMKQSEGNLVSFNNFLLADTKYKEALNYARRAHSTPNTVGIVFEIDIDCIQSATPFVSLNNLSYSEAKHGHVLFSFHSVFRIKQIKQIEDRIWQFSIKLIESNDKSMSRLADLLRDETRKIVGWNKLAKLMADLRDFDQAREIYLVLLDLLPENELLKKSFIYNELGLICDEIGDYQSALAYYQKAIEIKRKCLPPNHRSLSVAYNNIGELQRELGEYYDSLSSHRKTLSIKQKTLEPNHLSFATTYNNLGLANESLGEYSTALDFYKKSLDIRRKSNPSNPNELTTTYNNMGELHREMGNYPVALNYFEKVLNIRLKSNYPYDSSLAKTYNNMGLIYREMGEYNRAMEYLQKSLEVKQRAFSANHPSFAVTYNNMGDVNQQMGDYNEALVYYQKAFEIQEKAFSAQHPEVATTYNNIGVAHQSMGNYTMALSYFQKALKIRQKAYPVHHPAIGTSYNNLGHLHQLMGDYNTALEYYEKTRKLQEKSLSSNHPALSSTLNNIADVQRHLGNNKMALSLYKKSLEIKKKSLPANHPSLIVTYNNIGVLHQSMEEYPPALENYTKTLEIQKKTLPPNHPDLAAIYNNIGVAHQSMKDYATALQNYEKALKIQEKSLPPTHPDLSLTLNSIATALVGLGDLQKAVEHEQRAIDIAIQTLPPNHPHLVTYKNYLERIQIKIESTKNE